MGSACVCVLYTEAKILNLSKNSHFENLIFDKIHNFKISFFTKFTFPKSHFSHNSHFQNIIFHKIRIFKISFFSKFTFFNHQILGNFWIKNWFLPQCDSVGGQKWAKIRGFPSVPILLLSIEKGSK